MNRYLIACLGSTALLASVFGLGMRFQEYRQAQAQVKVLERDAKAIPKIEEKAHAREKQVEHLTAVVEQKEKLWADTALPVGVIDGLRTGGVDTGPITHR